MFLVTHVLSGSEHLEALSNCYITDMELTQLFQKSEKDVLPKYLQEKYINGIYMVAKPPCSI